VAAELTASLESISSSLSANGGAANAIQQLAHGMANVTAAGDAWTSSLVSSWHTYAPAGTTWSLLSNLVQSDATAEGIDRAGGSLAYLVRIVNTTVTRTSELQPLLAGLLSPDADTGALRDVLAAATSTTPSANIARLLAAAADAVCASQASTTTLSNIAGAVSHESTMLTGAVDVVQLLLENDVAAAQQVAVELNTSDMAGRGAGVVALVDAFMSSDVPAAIEWLSTESAAKIGRFLHDFVDSGLPLNVMLQMPEQGFQDASFYVVMGPLIGIFLVLSTLYVRSCYASAKQKRMQ